MPRTHSGPRSSLFAGTPAVALALSWAAALVGCPDPQAADDAPDADSDAGIVVVRVDAGPLPDPTDAGPTDAGPINSVVFVTSLTPPSGPLQGGNRVVIEGESFAPDSRALFAGVEATNCLVLTTRRMSCQVPAGAAAGPADVRVDNELGVGLFEGGYTYFSPLTITAIDPAVGSTDGGTAITLTGGSFGDAMIVLIGDRRVVGLAVGSDGTTATALAPPGAPGRVDVTVIDAFGRSTLPLAFTFESSLSINTVVPAIAAPGDVVELRGRGFAEDTGAITTAAVAGIDAVRDNLIDDARLRVVVPAVGAGPHDVELSRGATRAALPDGLVVLGPPVGVAAVTAVVPRTVDVDGGDVVTVVGEGFADLADPVAAVTFGGAAGTAVSVVDDRRLMVTVPAGAAGDVDVVVTRTSGATATLAAGATYVQRLRVGAAGTVGGAGSVNGGDTVTVTGEGFVDGVTVTLGGIACSDVVVVSPTELSCTTPAGAAGAVDIVVIGPDGQQVRADGGFVFEDTVSVLGVHPARGAYPATSSSLSPALASRGSCAPARRRGRWWCSSAASLATRARCRCCPTTCFAAARRCRRPACST
ncbi:MAG: hypothetical protein FJ137_21360 [Deltaproteobacteria bacterium]|nr:hypothetical protein [Deltaproteobacteria bacterium]